MHIFELKNNTSEIKNSFGLAEASAQKRRLENQKPGQYKSCKLKH